MLERVCCMRLKTAGFVFGWLGVVGAIIGILKYTFSGNGTTTVSAEGEVYASPGIETLISYLVNLLTSGLLIYGNSKDRHMFLIPWLICSVLGTIYGVILMLIFLVASLSDFGLFLGLLVFFVGLLSLSVYITYGIYSLYKEIESKNSPQQPMVYQPNSADQQFIKSVP